MRPEIYQKYAPHNRKHELGDMAPYFANLNHDPSSGTRKIRMVLHGLVCVVIVGSVAFHVLPKAIQEYQLITMQGDRNDQ